jgi:hypothetical protein
MLASVDDHLGDVLSRGNRARDGCSLDELRAGADDGEEFHSQMNQT